MHFDSDASRRLFFELFGEAVDEVYYTPAERKQMADWRSPVSEYHDTLRLAYPAAFEGK